MTERPAGLPDYRRPPLDEVAISVQFPPIEGLLDTHIREFWKTIRDDYPIAERQPRLESPLESSEPAQPVQVQLSLQPSPNIRMWMISPEDDFLVQVQNTRFIQNWRRRDIEYGHFEEIRNKFWQNYHRFKEFLDSRGLPLPEIQQIEVTYLNWIPEVPMTDFFRPATQTIVTINGLSRTPEEQSWSARYLIPTDIASAERLYVQCVPAIRPLTPGVRGSQLGLIFRAARESGFSDDEASTLIDSGRLMIVEVFTDLTTPAAQETWERYQ
jgi:uncharacterized protein (TIGR04255 family)